MKKRKAFDMKEARKNSELDKTLTKKFKKNNSISPTKYLANNGKTSTLQSY